jgi:hypothetical protein
MCIAHEKAIRHGLGLASPRDRDAVDPLQWAEQHAWEAVRRANGGEMPEERAESVVCGPREPTDEEMVETLAPIVAASQYLPGVFGEMSEETQADDIRRARRALQNPATGDDADCDDEAATFILAAWKAARAWGRK